MSNTELINCINLYKKRSRFDPHPLNPASQRQTRSNTFLSFCFATVGTSLIATAAPVTTALFGSPSFFPSQPLHNVKYSPVSEQTAHTYAQNRAATAFFNEFFTNNPDKAAYAFVSISLPTGATPSTFQEAVNSVDRRHWRFAMDSEFESLLDAQTWTLVDKKEAPNIISGKWVFKIKKDENGNIERYKARWVARGFTQQHKVDFNEIFAPVVRYSSVRTLLALANAKDLNLYGLH